MKKIERDSAIPMLVHVTDGHEGTEKMPDPVDGFDWGDRSHMMFIVIEITSHDDGSCGAITIVPRRTCVDLMATPSQSEAISEATDAVFIVDETVRFVVGRRWPRRSITEFDVVCRPFDHVDVIDFASQYDRLPKNHPAKNGRCMATRAILDFGMRIGWLCDGKYEFSTCAGQRIEPDARR